MGIHSNSYDNCMSGVRRGLVCVGVQGLNKGLEEDESE